MSSTPPPQRRLLRAPALRAALVFGAPTLAIVLLAMLPVITGSETLILRDVLESHLMLKAPQAEALRSGELPVLDVHRGGEPLTGNPNALPFYPSNLLYAVAPVIWALNAHFWLHWLLAPVAGYALGRAWELGRPASWAVGVCFATSGYFLSQLNLYNLVAGAALVPALVAAALRATEPANRHGADGGDGRARVPAAAAAGLLWGLILLSGDPTPVLAGALLAGGAVAVREPRALLRLRTIGPLAGAVALGTLVALPQMVETLRVLPSTYRGYQGYSGGGGGLVAGTWHPAHAIEWLLPLPFGRFDLRAEGAFWGESLFGGELPLLLSLYPGILALALVAAAGLPKFRSGCRRSGWAWGMAALGLVLAAGGTHPLGRWLHELPGAHLFRYPVKLWPLVAVAAALLCGVGWQRTFGGGPIRLARLAWPLAAIGALLAVVVAVVATAPGLLDRVTSAYGPERWTPELAAAERGRWIATAVLALALVAVHLLALLLARRRTVLAMAILLAAHAAGQIHLLRPLLLTDDAGLYDTPSALVARVPRGSRVAHAGYAGLFGAETVHAGFDNRALWTVRQDFASGIPPAGILNRGLRYELAPSPEGLSSFLGRVSKSAVAAGTSDADRVRALSRWGVQYLFAEEPLAGVSSELASGVGLPGVTDPVFVYRLARPAPDVVLADLPVRVPHLNAGWELFRSPGFDPGRHVVLPPQSATGAPGDDRTPPLPAASGDAPGRLRVLRRGDEVLEVETASPVPAVLVAQRAVQPVWRATVDGEPVAIEPANLYRIGVPVPAGRHRVRMWVDRGPLRLALAASGAGLLGLVALAAVPGFRRRREAVEVEGAAEDV